MNRYKGKIGLVTGSASGLGKAIAIRMAEEGASLILLDIADTPPLDFKLQAFSNVVKPDGAADWQVMFSVKLILPKQLFQ